MLWSKSVSVVVFQSFYTAIGGILGLALRCNRGEGFQLVGPSGFFFTSLFIVETLKCNNAQVPLSFSAI